MTSYASVAELKAYINGLTGGVQTSFTPDEDSLLQVFLDEATAEIERVTGRKFIHQLRTHYFDKESVTGRFLYLDDDLSGFYNEDDEIINGDGTVIDWGSEIYTYPDHAPYHKLYLFSSKSWVFNSDARISVTAMWGFSVTPPADIKRVCKRLAYFYWQKRGATGETTSLGDGQVNVASEYPQDIKSVLSRYKRGRIL